MARNITQRTFSRAGLKMALTAAMVATACGSAMAGTKPKEPFNRGLQSVRQPVVSYTSFAYDVQVGGNGAVSPSEAKRLEGWLTSINIAYGDRVSVASDAAYYGPAVRDGIGNVVARHGLLIEEDSALAAGTAPEGSVRLVVRRASASVPGCPNWSDKAETNGMGNTSRNFGCGVNGNLAAMVANPEDLVRGQTSDSDLRTATSNLAIKTYREKIPTGSGELKKITAGGN